MKQMYLIFIIGIFLISFTSATVTVTLNSPEDGVSDYIVNPLLFNASVSTTETYFTNVSLWTDQDGWSIKDINEATPENLIYDEIDDSSINNSLWQIVTSVGAVSENTDYMQISSTYSEIGSASAKAYSLPNLYEIRNATIRVYLSGVDSNAGSTITVWSGVLNIFGVNVKTVGRSDASGTGTVSDTSTYTIIKNTTAGENKYDVYDDGVFLSQITGTTNNITVTSSSTENADGQAISRIYYLYYTDEGFIESNSEEILSLNTIPNNNLKWNIQACDSNNDCNFSENNRTLSYKIFENSRTHNTTTYETAYETYQINVTANSSLTAVRLNYNGTLYSMTNQGSGIWSYSRDLPSSAIDNNSINFRFTYAGDTINTDYETYQDVDLIQFGLCNGTLTNDFFKLTFKDEADLSNLNASIQYSLWDYYLGTGTQTKEYLFSNTTENDDYTFCFTPTTRTLKIEPSVNYLSTDYPTRIYSPGILTLTSAVTNYVLYLLGVNDGIYTTFITTTSSNTIVTGADILITRDISGVTTTVGQGTTDGAGSATFFLNPNYLHTVTASKTGYGSSTTTVMPTQSTYTIVLSSTSNYTYISNTAGLLWSFFPGVGILNQSNNNFGFNVSSELGNLVGCKIELLSKDKTLVLSSGEYLTSNASICSVSVNYDVNETYPQIKGRLLVDVGDGYQILEEDAFWISLSVNSTGSTLTNWFNGLKEFDLRYFIGETDEIKTQHREYTQILLFFLIVTIICSVLNQLGWDIQTSGGMIFIMGGLVWVASIVGFLTLISISPFSFIDKYFVAFIYTFFMIGYATRSFS